jgi:Group II intron, maturase-specific domain
MNKNRMGGLQWRASEPMIAKPISIKLTGGKSGGCASKAVELTSGDLRRVMESFLGFSFTGEREPRRRIAPKAIARFKERIRERTHRTRGISLRQMVQEITTYLRGWLGYFGDCQPLRCCKVLNRGYAADFGRWCGSNGSKDERDFANFANGL